MGLIYSLAYLTITIATGRNADAGLPSISQLVEERRTHSKEGNLRVLVQSMETIGFTTLISSVSEAPGFAAQATAIEESVWNERGWTHQEGILSKRSLIFTTHQVYFHCRAGSQCEDIQLNNNRSFPITEVIEDVAKEPPRAWELISLQQYYCFLEKYSCRKLTNYADRLDACLAALQLLALKLETNMLWGLPEAEFQRGFLWSLTERASMKYYPPLLMEIPFKRRELPVLLNMFPPWS
jgi:hypothetical protein